MDGDPAEDASPRRFGPWRREVRSFLELFALAGMAFAQPIFDLLSRNSALFIVWRADQARYFALVVMVVVGPPIALWLGEVAVGLVVPRIRPWAHAALAAVLVATIGVAVVKKATDLGPVAIVAIGLFVGVVGGILVFRFAVARLWLRFLALAPVAFAVLFVTTSAASPGKLFDEPSVADVEVRRPTRIVMVVLDELPTTSLLDGEGRIDAELYPNFAALAGQSTWYRNHTTVAPITDLAVPAILTGRMPTDSGTTPTAASYPESLFTALGGTYEVNATELITRLCPASLCAQPPTPPGVRTGFRAMVDGTVDLWREFAQPTRSAALTIGALHNVHPRALRPGERFLRTLRPADGPRIDFLHIGLPHFPWLYLPTGQDYIAAARRDAGFDGKDWVSRWDALKSRQRHILQLRATDAYLGSVMQRLGELGELDSSTVVVTADHGAAFMKGEPFRAVSRANYPEIVWTPLFIKQANQREGAVDDRCARSIDVLPTLLEQVGAKAPWKLDGRSLLGAPRQCAKRQVFDWKESTLRPTDGSRVIEVDGPAGFRHVLAARGAPAGDPAIRGYSIGPYASLVGKDAAPLLEPDRLRALATVDALARYDSITPDAPTAWWPLISGWVGIRDSGVPLAVIANGRIAAIAETSGDLTNGRREYETMVPTALLRTEGNVIEIARILGPPSSPRLAKLRPVTP